jgi:hypothetical protein
MILNPNSEIGKGVYAGDAHQHRRAELDQHEQFLQQVCDQEHVGGAALTGMFYELHFEQLSDALLSGLCPLHPPHACTRTCTCPCK